MLDHDPAAWGELAEQKEREWREASQRRVESLEKACREKEQALATERNRLHKLKEDFKYNLKLLDERDQELNNYDTSFTELRAQLNAKNGEISELKIRLDHMKKTVDREAKATAELQTHYQQRLRERQTQVDQFKTSKDGELEKERQEFENFRRTLQLRLKEVEDELDTQKRELETGFEEALKRREHEFRVRADEMGAKVLEYELKAKLLEKEMEMMKSVKEKQTEECAESETRVRQLEKAVKERDWTVKDVTAMKDARISELETKLQQSESARIRMQEDFQRKFGEMDSVMREKEANLGKVKEACAEREEKLQGSVRDQQSKIEDQQIEIRRLEWQNQDLLKAKETQIGKLQEALTSQQSSFDHHLSEISHQQVSRNVQCEALKENEGKIRADLQQKKQDIERYKKDLSDAAERETSLERAKAQLELDWQRRFEDMERHQYDKSEDLIKRLTSSRDQAVAELKEKTREQEQRDMLIKVLQRDRNLAMANLKQHGITLNKNVNVDSSLFDEESHNEIVELQEQNRNLRAVIKQMREQMEQLGQELPSMNVTSVNPSPDYVSSLEKQVAELKKKTRDLQQDLDSGKGTPPSPHKPVNSDEVMAEVKDNTMVRNHIQMLNNVLGSVRSEKVELTAQVRKQQARIQFLENQIAQLEKQPRQKQVEIDQLQYEVNSGKRRHEAEMLGLRSRVSDLEQQLIETRKEADEYYRSTLERNAEVTALSNELSALKMEMSEKRPAVNFGAQELVIQQLQDEILRLKKKGSGMGLSGTVESNVTKPGEITSSELRAKLKQAVLHISQLAKEKQQLIEIGNRLRAELKKAHSGGDVPAPRPVSSPSARPQVHKQSRSYSHQYNTKLSQLEALQYQLTKQELQYAQNFGGPVVESTDKSLDEVPTKQNRDEFDQTQSSEGEVRTSRPWDDRKLLLSMSSGGGESLQEVWRMLDDRQSPGIFTPKTPRSRADLNRSPSPDNLASPAGPDKLHVSGTKSSMANRPSSEKKSSTVKLKDMKKASSKIRNYNIRDDTTVR